jgi:TonB family protein
MLENAVQAIALELADSVRASLRSEITESGDPAMEEPPLDESAAVKGFRAPIPYRRLKPVYTTEAALYDITATVEILVDLDAAGSILRTRIVRWAGYGLDESVDAAVRSMNWRPAERNGKSLPMRFLLRYNFRKVEKEKD